MQLEYAFELPNDLRAIEKSVQYLMERGQAVGFDGDRLRLNLRVGLTEALANAMLYGNCRDPRKRVRVEASLTPEAITVRVTDEGRGFDPSTVIDPTLPASRVRAGGRGLYLIRQLMDHVEFNERGNSITMVLRREATNGAPAQPQDIPAFAELVPLPPAVETALAGFHGIRPDVRFRLAGRHGDRWLPLYTAENGEAFDWKSADSFDVELTDA